MATGLQTRHGNILQEAFKNGLQSFVNTTTNTLAATSTAGTPAAGTFYSTVVGRASVVDISQDLKASFGVERIMTQQIVQLQNEFGPNGEPVFSAVNDERGLIRFVGGWTNDIGQFGQRQFCSQNLTDYVEVTFYGTGLNVLLLINNNNFNYVASVDGGAEGSNLVSGSYSAIITGRNYSENKPVNVVSGLALGVHTVKIRNNTASNVLSTNGFEIINTNSLTSLNVNPGIAYVDGLKIVSSAAQSIAYNSSFETGTLGTRGGHVVAYLKQDGTVGKAVTPVNAASAFLTSADHTNEEIQRTYFFREFGAGRADDFSLLAGTGSNRVFTLDDGTTTLVAQNYAVTSIGYGDSLVAASGAGDFLIFTFVGTGLDIVNNRGLTSTCSYTISVDGVSVLTSTVFGGSGLNNTVKICSGLPYGTHTVKFLFVSGVTNSAAISNFKVYQPKKPSIPTGAIELSDYNVMATYSAPTAAGAYVTSPGVMRKSCSRELTLINGTGGIDYTILVDSTGNYMSAANYVESNHLNAKLQYTFFGTGIEWRHVVTTNQTTNCQILLNGLPLNSTYPGAAGITVSNFGGTYSGTLSNASALLSTLTTNVLNKTAATVAPATFGVSGLPLGTYTITLTQAAASTTNTYLSTYYLDVITPIYSAKSNTTYDQQNTLPVGSNSLSDNRKTSAIKEALPSTKPWTQAIGLSNVTTNSTSFVPLPDMSCTIKTSGAPLKVTHIGLILPPGAGVGTYIGIFVNGVQYPSSGSAAYVNTQGMVAISVVIPVPAGVHKVDIYWRIQSGTGSATSYADGAANRILTVEEK